MAEDYDESKADDVDDTQAKMTARLRLERRWAKLKARLEGEWDEGTRKNLGKGKASGVVDPDDWDGAEFHVIGAAGPVEQGVREDADGYHNAAAASRPGHNAPGIGGSEAETVTAATGPENPAVDAVGPGDPGTARLPGLATDDSPTTAMTRENSSIMSQLSQNPGSARDHPLYKNDTPSADGLFHCPWEGTAGCHHRPSKVRRNYE